MVVILHGVHLLFSDRSNQPEAYIRYRPARKQPKQHIDNNQLE